MIAKLAALKAAGILGINRRNADYTLTYNHRRFFPLVDDKLKTKLVALRAGIAVPELYATIDTQRAVRGIHDTLSAHPDFVLKPACGSGGEGIIVVSGRQAGNYRTISGHLITPDDLEYHCSNILGGMYSLGGQPDKILVEYRVKFDRTFETVSYMGVPDIRIIVFQGIPVMAMIRLPSKESDGKANLHQGAIGAGISIRSGTTLDGVWHNRIIREHPDTGNAIKGFKIPKWDELLTLAARCYELSGLGYQAVDIVLDQDLGPLILELNARPGLNIQIANQSGLRPRLKLVEDNIANISGPEKCVHFAKENFP